MGEHFLKWINIVDFKCFHNFEAKDFKRVNLISGKNNVGKTAFMEACYIHTNTKDISSFSFSLTRIKSAREKLNMLNDFIKGIAINLIDYLESTTLFHSISENKKIGFRLENNDGIKEYIFNINDDIKIINSNSFSLSDINSNIYILDNYGYSSYALVKRYTSIQAKDKEFFLNELIQKFDPSIESFKVIGDKPQCKHQGKYIDLTEFGDGLNHYISIICTLYACENGQLFIDEIDNGIHYTQLENMWKLILEISKEVNCQVFATTHSIECINAYARVAKELEDKEITFVELGKNKNNEIKSITMDFDRFQDEIKNANEVRGW